MREIMNPRDDPKYAKYFKMLKMHLPRGAVEMKMQADGFDDTSILDAPESDGGGGGGGGGGGTNPRDDSKYAKYFKMLKMHLPRRASSSFVCSFLTEAGFIEFELLLARGCHAMAVCNRE